MAISPVAELTRYTFYTLCLTFALLTWSLTISHLLPAQPPPSPPDTCTIFSGQHSSLCAVLIAFGIAMTIALLAAVAWHSLIFLQRPFMPYLAEAVLFACLACLWFVFAVAVLIKGRTNAKEDITMRAVIAGGFLASAVHLANAVLAFLQDHVAEVEKERLAELARREEEQEQEMKEDSEEMEEERDPDEDCDIVRPAEEP